MTNGKDCFVILRREPKDLTWITDGASITRFLALLGMTNGKDCFVILRREPKDLTWITGGATITISLALLGMTKQAAEIPRFAWNDKRIKIRNLHR